MNYAYIRFSTDKQDETQQVQAIKEFCDTKRIAIDAFEKDEGISGGVSFRNRNLNKLVEKLDTGDCLVVSEISRLGRSMSDLNKLINDELKPRKVRLIVIKMGIDMDCSNLTAIDEMIFFSLSFAAQIEKEMIQQRTQSGIDARKELIRKDGGFISKTGRYCTKLGREKGSENPNAVLAMNMGRTSHAEDWKARSDLYKLVKRLLLKGKTRAEILEEAREFYEDNPVGYGTRMGKPLNAATLSRWAKEILRRG